MGLGYPARFVLAQQNATYGSIPLELGIGTGPCVGPHQSGRVERSHRVHHPGWIGRALPYGPGTQETQIVEYLSARGPSKRCLDYRHRKPNVRGPRHCGLPRDLASNYFECGGIDLGASHIPRHLASRGGSKRMETWITSLIGDGRIRRAQRARYNSPRRSRRTRDTMALCRIGSSPIENSIVPFAIGKYVPPNGSVLID